MNFNVRLKYCLGFVPILLLYVWMKNGAAELDPDTYYHLAMARELWNKGMFIWSMPQLEDLHWNLYFPNWYYLFHVCSAILYGSAGFNGAMAISWIFGILALILVYSYFVVRLSILESVCLVVFGLLLHNYFIFRFTLHRPYLAAIAILIFLFLRFRWARPIHFFFASILYCQFYYIFLLPIAVVFFFPAYAFAMSKKFFSEARDQYIFWASLLGLAIGIFLHPYYPWPIAEQLDALRAGFHTQVPLYAKYAHEGEPFLPIVYFLFALPIFISLACVGGIWLCKAESRSEHRIGAAFLFCFLLLLSGKTAPRSFEYLAPLATIALGCALAYISKPMRALALAALFLAQVPAWWILWEDEHLSRVEESAKIHESLRIAAMIPNEAQKIYHCNWDFGPFIIYQRPDLRFVDILSPKHLFNADREKFLLRHRLNRGLMPDPLLVLREKFHADHVICGEEALTVQLRGTPAVKEISDGRGNIHLFRL